MAFTNDEEAAIRQALFGAGGQISELPAADNLEGAQIEISTPSGESKRVNLVGAVSSLNKRVAGRRWNETLSTPTGEAWGNIDFLRELPALLGLGCYLVTNDRKMRKLDPTDHHRFADGSPAALDGSDGQYMWGWNAHWYGFRSYGGYYYEAVSLEQLGNEWNSYYIPSGGTSALGCGVVDRQATGGAGSPRLCSLISDLPRYRGGNNESAHDGTYKSQLGMPATQVDMVNHSKYARERGEGWEANWYVSRAVQEYLFRIIMGTRNSQAAFNPAKDANGLFQGGLGEGVTQMQGWSEHNNIYPIIPCSAGVGLGDGVGISPFEVRNSSGQVVYTAPVPVFFGLKNMYGNLWSSPRGLVIDAGVEKTRTYVSPSLYRWDSSNDSSVAGMLMASEQPRGGGFIKRISMNKLCCMPTEVGGSGASSATYYCDLFYTEVPNGLFGLRCRLAGGPSSGGINLGISTADVSQSLSFGYTALSSPLCFFTEDPVVG